MQPPTVVRRRRAGSLVLAGVLLSTGTVLAAWKHNRLTAERSATQPEPIEAVTIATAAPQEHRETTTAIGTVLALESITLRNELAGTVRQVSLTPGAIVEPGAVLVALDTSVEEAELRAQQAQAALAETTLRRHVFLRQHEATLRGRGRSGPRPARRLPWRRSRGLKAQRSPRRSSARRSAPGSAWPTCTPGST